MTVTRPAPIPASLSRRLAAYLGSGLPLMHMAPLPRGQMPPHALFREIPPAVPCLLEHPRTDS